MENKILVLLTSEDQELIGELIETIPGVSTPEQALLFALRMLSVQKALENGINLIKNELQKQYGRTHPTFKITPQPSPQEVTNKLLKLVKEMGDPQSNDSVLSPQNPSGQDLKGIMGGGVGSGL